MIYVISVFFEHIAGQFSVHSPVARNILLGLLTLLLCFGPVILGTSGEKKRKPGSGGIFLYQTPRSSSAEISGCHIFQFLRLSIVISE